MTNVINDVFFRPPTRLIVAAVTFVTIAVGSLYYIYHRPVTFESQAKVWIQSKMPVTGGNSADGLATPFIYFFNNPLGTAMEVMRSSVVLDRAQKLLAEPDHGSHKLSVDELRGGIRVELVKDADVISVQYFSGNPYLSRDCVAAALEAFMQVNSTQSAGSAVQSRMFLERQLATERKKYQDVEDRLSAFQQKNKTVNLSSQTGDILSEISNLQSDIRQTKVSLQESNTRLGYIQPKLGVSLESASAANALSDNAVLRKLREMIAEDEVKLIAARNRFGPESARVVRLQLALDRAKKEVAIRAGLPEGSTAGESLERLLPSKESQRGQLLLDATRVTGDKQVLEQKLVTLNGMLAASMAKLKGIPDQQSELAELTRLQQDAAKTLSDVERKLSTAQMMESIASETSNIQIIEEPSLASQPESGGGKKLFGIAMAAAVALSGFAYLLIRQLDPHLYSANECKQLLSLPIIGWLGDQPALLNLNRIEPLHRIRHAVWGALEGRRFIIASTPDSGDGKTALAVGLALSLAESGKRVVLVDLDSISQATTRLFSREKRTGVSELLSIGDIELASQSAELVAPNLFLLPAGQIANRPLLEGLQLEALKRSLLNSVDVVIFDTVPFADSAETLGLLGADSFLLVAVRLAHTLKSSVKCMAGQIHGSSGAVVATNAKEQDYISARGQMPSSGGLSFDSMPAAAVAAPSESMAAW